MRKKNIVGDNIRKLREKAGLTQEALALKSGLSQGYINQLESGKRRYTQKSIEVIADALSVSIVELFKERESQQPSLPTDQGEKYKKKSIDKKELFALLKDLPEHITHHYFTLLKLEQEIWEKKL